LFIRALGNGRMSGDDFLANCVRLVIPAGENISARYESFPSLPMMAAASVF